MTYALGCTSTLLDGVLAIRKNLRFNDGNETVLLADGSITSEAMSILKEGTFSGLTSANLENSTPTSSNLLSNHNNNSETHIIFSLRTI